MKINKIIFRKDYKQTKSLELSGKEAVSNAIRHAKALGLTISYIQDGAVYEEEANGNVTLIKIIEKKENPFVLTKGMVLYAK